MTATEPTPAYPWHTLRVLHSAWVDWMTRTPAEVRDPVLACYGGLSFPHWLLATMRHGYGPLRDPVLVQYPPHRAC